MISNISHHRVHISGVARVLSSLHLLHEFLLVDRQRSRWAILYISLVPMDCMWRTSIGLMLVISDNHSLVHAGVMWHLQGHGSRVIISKRALVVTWWGQSLLVGWHMTHILVTRLVLVIKADL